MGLRLICRRRIPFCVLRLDWLISTSLITIFELDKRGSAMETSGEQAADEVAGGRGNGNWSSRGQPGGGSLAENVGRHRTPSRSQTSIGLSSARSPHDVSLVTEGSSSAHQPAQAKTCPGEHDECECARFGHRLAWIGIDHSRRCGQVRRSEQEIIDGASRARAIGDDLAQVIDSRGACDREKPLVAEIIVFKSIILPLS